MGKGGKVTPNSDGKVEVLINDRYYDVTNFRHPGGSVIGFYSNKPIDATVPFNNFHIRSARAFKILDKLPSRPSDLKQDAEEKKRAAMLADFVEFQRQLEKEGFFKPSLPHTIYRLSEIFLMHVIGLYLFFQTPFPYARVLGIIILGVVSGRCGWLMHEGGHYSMTGNIQLDKLFQVVLYGIGCGMSGSWWRSQHNKHHSMPQKLSHDVDLNTLPLVCFTEKIVKRIGFLQKLWIRGQAVLFPVITTLLVALGWQFYLHPRHVVRAQNWAEAISMIARYALIGYFFVPKFGVSQTLLYYLAYTWVGANYIFLNFAVSHTHLPVVPKDDTKVNWIEYSAIYTMNVKPGPFKFINWWMGYLNFQIEHHLFPCMPQFRHPIISPRVKQFFEKHGFKYDQRSYVDALKVTFANLDKVGHDVFLG